MAFGDAAGETFMFGTADVADFLGVWARSSLGGGGIADLVGVLDLLSFGEDGGAVLVLVLGRFSLSLARNSGTNGRPLFILSRTSRG